MFSLGTSSREICSRDPGVVGEIPHLDRTPPPDPQYPSSIISHNSAYGKIRSPPPRGESRAAMTAEVIRGRALPAKRVLGVQSIRGSPALTGRSFDWFRYRGAPIRG
jgi:hypothetical protein